MNTLPKPVSAVLLLAPTGAVAQDRIAATASDWIALEDPLDETAGDLYCLDVSGTVVDAPLLMQAHTCKEPPVEDQLFTVDYPRLGNISVTDYDYCVAPRRVGAGATVFTTACRRDTKQRWISTPDGQIHPSGDTSLCLTVDDAAAGTPAGGGGDYWKRTLSLQACDDFDPEYNTWIIPGGSIGR
jgi:hypothetical protein